MVEENIKCYTLKETEIVTNRGGISNSAAILCALCGVYLYGSGGPRTSTVCKACGDVAIRGDARGCIVWDEDPTQDTGER